MTIAKSALKASCLFVTATLLTAGALSAPQIASATERADTCKPVKAVKKAKAKKAVVHKAKAKAAKAKTVVVAHKVKPKPKVIKIAAAPCDCRKEVKVVKIIQPVIEREVTVYRAEPRQWHAPYVDEVRNGNYATYEKTSHIETRRVQRVYTRNDHYLSVDTRPGRHRHTRWTRWTD